MASGGFAAGREQTDRSPGHCARSLCAPVSAAGPLFLRFSPPSKSLAHSLQLTNLATSTASAGTEPVLTWTEEIHHVTEGHQAGREHALGADRPAAGLAATDC